MEYAEVNIVEWMCHNFWLIGTNSAH